MADAAEPSAADWLARMSEAARTTNYQGVIVYQTRDRLETMRVVHRYAGGREVERVQTLTGDPREILKQGNQVICLLPKDRKVTLELRDAQGPVPRPQRRARRADLPLLRIPGHRRGAHRRPQVPRHHHRAA